MAGQSIQKEIPTRSQPQCYFFISIVLSCTVCSEILVDMTFNSYQLLLLTSHFPPHCSKNSSAHSHLFEYKPKRAISKSVLCNVGNRVSKDEDRFLERLFHFFYFQLRTGLPEKHARQIPRTELRSCVRERCTAGIANLRNAVYAWGYPFKKHSWIYGKCWG